MKRKLENGQLRDRQWLVYSTTTDRVFCFCCKLFSNCNTSLATTGSSEWKNMGARLTNHESSKGHTECTVKWVELEERLQKKHTVDEQAERQIHSEKICWRNVFDRLLSIIQYLAEHNMAFRGSVDKLYHPHNGNFLSLVELLVKFDPVLQAHIRRNSE